MVTLAQRLEQLRTERGLSRVALAAALGFPKMSIEKFETGRQTPSREQQEKLASYFEVSVFYLRCESDDRTRQETWMDKAYAQEEPSSYVPVPAAKREPVRKSGQESGSMFDAFRNSKPFQDMVRATLLEILRSPEGQEILERTVRREMDRKK